MKVVRGDKVVGKLRGVRAAVVVKNKRVGKGWTGVEV